MTISINADLQRRIEERIRTGGYATAEEVLTAAMSLLDREEQMGDFAPGELQKLIDEAEQGGPSLNGEDVWRELRDIRAQNRG